MRNCILARIRVQDILTRPACDTVATRSDCGEVSSHERCDSVDGTSIGGVDYRLGHVIFQLLLTLRWLKERGVLSAGTPLSTIFYSERDGL